MRDSRLVSLIYCSRAADGLANDGGELAELLVASEANNQRAQIGGVLCLTNAYLFQCLEGPSRPVNALYRRIAADPRHTDCHLLDFRNIRQRLFESWGMGFVDPGLPTGAWGQEAGSDPTFSPYMMSSTEAYRFVTIIADPQLLTAPIKTAEQVQSNLQHGITH